MINDAPVEPAVAVPSATTAAVPSDAKSALPTSYATAAVSAPVTAADSTPSYDLPSADSGLDTSGFPLVTKKYDKQKSFFDELSAGDRSSSSNVGREQRRVDVDTFGSEAQSFRSQHSLVRNQHSRGGRQGQSGQRAGAGRGGRPQGQWRSRGEAAPQQ